MVKSPSASELEFCIFSDETTVFLENPVGFKCIHKDDQNISEVKRRREKKLNIWGAISYKGKVSIEIFEENLNSDKYVQIFSSKIEEMKMINNSNSILLQVDN